MRSTAKNLGLMFAAAGLALTVALPGIQSASAEQGDDALHILHEMSDYIEQQKTISLTYDSDIEVITSELQKIQFTNSGKVQLTRPDKLHVSRTGGYADVDLVFDGKTVTALGRDANTYTQLDAPGSVDDLIDHLKNEHNLTAPGADLLLAHVFEQLADGVIDAKHIGQGVIDGIECEHLAFRNMETDWQIWIESGAHPIPRKYVITSKGVAEAPQYTLRIKDWKTDPISADAFTFAAPPGAKKVAMDALGNVDEVPQGVVTGAKK